MRPFTVTGNENINVSPQAALSDETISIQLKDFSPHCHVVLKAEMTDDVGTVWGSHAAFTANEEGAIDLEDQMPDAGTYDEADTMGLIWSMVPQAAKNPRSFARKHYSFFVKEKLHQPSIITFKAHINGAEVATAFLKRRYMLPGVTFEDIQEKGIVGRFYWPPDRKYQGAVLLIGGADGPRMDSEAALLASHNIAAFAIKYIGPEPELPDYLTHVPIEYFKKCIDWLKDKTKLPRVGLLGRSKGSEGALIAATLFPDDIGAVIANMPSSVVSIGIGRFQNIPFPPAWTFKKKALPFLHIKVTFQDWVRMKIKLSTGKQFSSADFFATALRDDKAAEKAEIPIEKIQSPLFLISAAEDAIWPSTIYGDQIVDRLKKKEFKYPVEHLDCKQSGHYIGNANWPAGLTDYWKMYGCKLAGPAGGSPKHNARAARDYWKQAKEFLKKYLKD